MDTFLAFLKGFGALSIESEEILREKLKIVNLEKDDYYLEAGEVCREIGFITEGVVRAFYCDKDANQFTRYFLHEGHFATNLYSFNDETVSSEYLQALTDTRLVVITKEKMEYFYKNIPEWTGIILRVTEKALLEKMQFKTMMLEADATTRYLNFVTKFPELMNRVSLGHIASFLGVTQSSLSRIRKSVSKNDFLSYGKNDLMKHY